MRVSRPSKPSPIHLLGYNQANIQGIVHLHMLQIPTVTQDDLDVFHARLFGSTIPSQAIYREPGTTNEDTQNYQTQEEVDDDDDLGYYPDGNKRTLTDDQIAMFRHSEIYSILRERQLSKENKEVDLDDGPEDFQPDVAVASEGLMDEKEAEQTAGIAQEEGGITLEHQKQEDLGSAPSRTKRKRNDAENSDRQGRPYTARRLVRELDSPVAQDCVLDYDDEPIVTDDSVHSHPEETKASNHGSHEEHSASIKGQKIWWPVIQHT